ncbi:MAG: class E sortase [Propionibacteriaceae bacterium]|nr:class E sortase [Propionibacteriaceae bacterium]
MTAAKFAKGRRHSWRGAAGLLGEILVTLGVVVGLFAVWQLVWTDVIADGEQAAVVANLTEYFAGDVEDKDASRITPNQESEAGTQPEGAFAIVHIPRFGTDYARPLFTGVTREILMQGIGHYPATVLPGEVGNFSMAGHRTTYGKPFSKIAQLRRGDHIIVETATDFFVYEITDYEVVLPTQTAVVLPVPNRVGVKPTQALLTMTSCHPEFSSRLRYVQHGRLLSTYTRAEGIPAELLKVKD